MDGEVRIIKDDAIKISGDAFKAFEDLVYSLD